MRIKNKRILAFVHIEKAAGQTLIRILENNFIYKHCRVAPLKKDHQGVFSADDMKTLFRINPFVEAVSGHSIKPFSDLQTILPNVRYITLMRDPAERYISHYQYWVQMMKINIRFEEFIRLESMRNFQTKKIAGTPNANKAKKIMRDKFFLAGTVEEFDNFLIVLSAKLAPYNLDCVYKRKNVSKKNTIKRYIYENLEKYREQIVENNLLDIELYHFVQDNLFQLEKKAMTALHRPIWNNKKEKYNFQFRREFIGRLYRNLYFSPIFKLIRYRNGLSMNGSY